MKALEDVIEKWKSRWTSTLLESFIFHAISIRERYGGELVELSRQYLDSGIKVPTVYAILKRASDDNLLSQEKQRAEGVTRGTKRKYYYLTDQGTQYLEYMRNRIDGDIRVLGDTELTLNVQEEKE